MKKKTILCEDCEGQVMGLLNDLKSEACHMKRCRILLDCIDDLEVCLETGDISLIIKRDKEYQKGKRVGRRIQRKK